MLAEGRPSAFALAIGDPHPYFTVVSGGRNYEVCADGSVKDACILVECKTVVVRGGVAELPGKDMIAQISGTT